MPSRERSGSFLARHRREILAVLGGGLAALGLWFFLGSSDRVDAGPGTFSRPAPSGSRSQPTPGLATADSVAAADSAHAAAAPNRDAGADADGTPPAERVTSARTRAAADASPRDARTGELAPLASLRDRENAAETVSERAGAQAAPGTRRDARGTDPVAGAEPPPGREASSSPEVASRGSISAGAAGADEPADTTGGSAPEPGAETPELRPTSPETAGETPEARAEPPAPATPVEARVAAEVAVARYQHAIESADLVALRAAHPGITAEAEAAWREVFENGETFVALLRITDFRATGSEAHAEIRGSCHFYDLSLRRFVDVPVAFDLYLHHDGRRWRPVLASGETPEAAP